MADSTREDLYRALAATLLYPGPDYRTQLDACRQLADAAVPEAARRLDTFAAATADLSDVQFEELYTRTFDHNPTHAMEIGWHLFGEDYHRGALLVRLRQELAQHGIPESNELPDHLTHVLLLLARMAPAAAHEFAGACVVPALDKLLEGLRRGDSPYVDLLEGVAAVIAHSCENALEETKDGSCARVS
jgi:nitrate reductase molybdenum cofactor assembly chaperone